MSASFTPRSLTCWQSIPTAYQTVRRSSPGSMKPSAAIIRKRPPGQARQPGKRRGLPSWQPMSSALPKPTGNRPKRRSRRRSQPICRTSPPSAWAHCWPWGPPPGCCSGSSSTTGASGRCILKRETPPPCGAQKKTCGCSAGLFLLGGASAAGAFSAAAAAVILAAAAVVTAIAAAVITAPADKDEDQDNDPPPTVPISKNAGIARHKRTSS